MSDVLRVVIRRPGGYDRLGFERVRRARLEPGQVRVAVAAAGVNYADCVTRMGLYASARTYVGYPITPGFEVAGRVAEVGEGGAGLAPGDAVVAVTRFFGYASEVVVPARQVFRRPAGLSAVRAAALPVAFLTAWYGLEVLGAVRPGARVLVHSAAGGVGGLLAALARRAGARCVGVVGAAHKIDPARRMGAHEVIVRDRRWAEAARAAAPDGYDLVLDATGVATLRASYDLLAPMGRLVVYGFHSMLPKGRGRPNPLALAWKFLRTPRFSPLDLTGKNRSVLGFNLSYLFSQHALLAEGIEALTRCAAQGVFDAQPVTAVPFAEVARAHRMLESGETVGKLVLVVDRAASPAGSGPVPLEVRPDGPMEPA